MLISPVGVVTIVGNDKISGYIIENLSAHPYRRVDRTAQPAFGVDPVGAIARRKPALAAIPNVVATPARDVEMLAFNTLGTQLAVPPYCHTENYWEVDFGTAKLTSATCGSKET